MENEELYRKMYLSLFNAVTDALALMESEPEQARLALQSAQQHCEALFMDADPALRAETKYERNGYGFGIRFV